MSAVPGCTCRFDSLALCLEKAIRAAYACGSFATSQSQEASIKDQQSTAYVSSVLSISEPFRARFYSCAMSTAGTAGTAGTALRGPPVGSVQAVPRTSSRGRSGSGRNGLSGCRVDIRSTAAAVGRAMVGARTPSKGRDGALWTKACSGDSLEDLLSEKAPLPCHLSVTTLKGSIFPDSSEVPVRPCQASPS